MGLSIHKLLIKYDVIKVHAEYIFVSFLVKRTTSNLKVINAPCGYQNDAVIQDLVFFSKTPFVGH
jgi:hypothetical protein